LFKPELPPVDNCRDARLGGIRGLERLRSWSQVSDIREAAGCQRNCFKIVSSDYGLMHGTSRVDWLCCNRRRLTLYGHSLLDGLRYQCDGDFADGANCCVHLSPRFRKTLSIHSDLVGTRQQVVETKFSASIAERLALERGFGRMNHDLRSGYAAAVCVLHDAPERGARILCKQRKWQEGQRDE